MILLPRHVAVLSWLVVGIQSFSGAVRAAATVADGSRAPNIILAMTDDQGWGDAGFRGHAVLRTPVLDEMARRGVRFERFYAPTVCSPTRASVLTGRHPFRMGIFSANAGGAEDTTPSRYLLPRGERTLAEALKPRGYTNGFFGKWHLGDFDGPRKSSPDEHGFDHWFATVRKVPSLDPTHYSEDGRRVAGPLRGDDSALLGERAAAFARAAARAGRPFLIVLWFHAPHEPTLASEAARAPYAERPPAEQHYFGSLAATDAALGRLRATVRELGIARDTLLWFCSDNGPARNGPGSSGGLRDHKGTLFEGGIRVPGLLEWPAAFPGPLTVAAPCVTSDIVPTILDWLGLRPAPGRVLDGLSLRPLLEGRAAQRGRAIGFELGGMAVWLEDRWKLVAHLRGSGEAGRAIHDVKLFNLDADPREERDLAAAEPERARAMTKALSAWRLSCARSRTMLRDSQ
jgi:arylsulfatase A-like enzyme